MEMKKLAALGLSGCMLISLASCGNSNQENNDKKSDTKTNGTVSAEDSENNAKTEASPKNTVTKAQLGSMENVIGALLSYMYDNGVQSLLTENAGDDAQITEEYLLNYVNTASANDTRSYKAVLPDADTDTEYYKEQESSIVNILEAGLGDDLTKQLESTESIYYLDNSYYIEAMDCDKTDVKYTGKGGKKTLTSKKKFTYKYSLTDTDGNINTGKLNVYFEPNDDCDEGISVRKIVITDSSSRTADNAEDAYNENEDGEARKQVSMTNAEKAVKKQFGSEYDYVLDSIEDIDDNRYYVYKQTMKIEDEDAQAHKKALQYIFYAVDGSAVYTGTADDDGYYIDYPS